MLWEKYSICKIFRVLKSTTEAQEEFNYTLHHQCPPYTHKALILRKGEQNKAVLLHPCTAHCNLPACTLVQYECGLANIEGPSVFCFSSPNRNFYLSKITEPLMLGFFNCALESNTEQNDFSKKETATNKLIRIKF